MKTTLVLGGARSGKSSHAQALSEALSPRRVYLATAQPLDSEMIERIERHKSDRGQGWETIEEPLKIAMVIRELNNENSVVLLDCLTLWLSNLMHHEWDLERETADLIAALQASASPVIMVSNEVGLGLVPTTPLGREFRDAQGRLNQRLAAMADTVEFIAAGLPIRLKG